MAATGDTLTMPDGSTFLIVESAADSGGERVEFEITMQPGALGPPRHFHPDQEERWRVIAGELTVLVDSEWRPLREGESLTIAPGTVHTLRNRSGVPVRFRDVHTPALTFQDYIETLHRAASAGKLKPRPTPSTLLHGAMILRGHRSTQLSASPVQRAAESGLAALGRLLRRRV